jgi:hypothetical protein
MKVHPLQYALNTYASETNKVLSTWREAAESDLGFDPRPKSSAVGEILRRQLLSVREFFGEFLDKPVSAADRALPTSVTIQDRCQRAVALARARFHFLRNRMKIDVRIGTVS